MSYRDAIVALMIPLVRFLLVFVVACSHPLPTGASLLLDVRPAAGPSFASQYDFEFIETVEGEACLVRSTFAFNDSVYYWVGGISNLPSGFAGQVVAAAAFNAIGKIEGADTMLPTRAIVEAKGEDRVCAKVWGKAMRVMKARRVEPDEVRVLDPQEKPLTTAPDALQAPTER